MIKNINSNQLEIMKLRSIFTALFLMMFSLSFCQTPQLESPVNDYNKDRLWTKFFNITTQKEDSIQLLNPKMLNIMFSNKVGTAFGGTNDLSLQKFFASLDADDTSFSLGVNFDSRRGKETQRLKWILSAGAKIKASNNFATVYKDGDFQEDNIGATFKITLISRGNINFTSYDSNGLTKLRSEAIQNNHKALEKKYDDAADEFNKDNLSDFNTTATNAAQYDSEVGSVQDQLDKKKEKAYIEMAKEEVKYIEDNKMYRFLSNKWYSLEVFTPFGENSYNVTLNTSTALERETFYAFSATFTGNYMRQYSNGVSAFLRVLGQLRNNNNILVDNLQSQTFQSTTLGTNNVLIVTDSKDGYITDFDQFLTTTFSIEPAVFFFNNTVGFSPALELNLGTYDKTNWKLGIPISLKDKEGKPKVNFEIQWKEINTFNSNIHLLGFSASFLFGDLIN